MYQCFTNPIMDGHHKTLNIITMSGEKQFDYLKGNRITDKEQSKITEVTANIWGLFFSPWALKSCNCLSKLIYQNDLSLFPSISTEQVKRGEVTLLGQNDNEPCWLQKKTRRIISYELHEDFYSRCTWTSLCVESVHHMFELQFVPLLWQ